MPKDCGDFSVAVAGQPLAYKDDKLSPIGICRSFSRRPKNKRATGAQMWEALSEINEQGRTVPAVIDEIDRSGVGRELASAMPPTGDADTLAPRCARRGDQGSVNFGVRLAHGVAFGVASRELDRKIGESFVP